MGFLIGSVDNKAICIDVHSPIDVWIVGVSAITIYFWATTIAIYLNWYIEVAIQKIKFLAIKKLTSPLPSP